LIWGAPSTPANPHVPAFVTNETNATKLEEFMVEYINQTMAAVGDYPIAWDVVNEAVDNSNDPSKVIKVSAWSKIDDYVCKAFKAARAANPNTQLYYNDYKHASMNGTYKARSDKVFNLIKDLKAKGCPIDGVGFQNHIDIAYSDDDLAGVSGNMQRYAAIGVKVHITEMDVRCNATGAHGTETCPYTTWPASALEKQGQLFNNFLKICLEEPNCMSFESWGFTDKYTSEKAP